MMFRQTGISHGSLYVGNLVIELTRFDSRRLPKAASIWRSTPPPRAPRFV